VPVAGPDVLWDTKLVTVDALTNCAAAPTTTTAAPTTSEAPTESTALVPPSTIATPTTPPPAIDIATTVAVGVPPTLPATGGGDTLLGAGVLVLAVGTALMVIKGRGRATS
jgi:hypothetical protein